ncbi:MULTISPECIES: flagellar hook assembly protein FlgD [Pseudoalteromonas]|jgi:flagellar basal-body rod modification protein FlgD|uniref:Basal-body rod modification protein FlgD n=2 Tax=Pseudoalteromonas TaxID=53246 RepID=A0AAD0TZE5_9GAMM|nr:MULTISPECIES: flagellar hook assembly protein FlgD [Pseudoalteromonas]MCP4057649.1 flagellar hook assembly protein FlgD [Pseudoalteromonas sp.]MDC9523014.1 flagellar hook assembly protein FlgD [Pseudoalteromonas sp. Angola-31]MDY6888392.1 flagellar hook assembly protein FlgD [Pseudomonadota bacterium]AYM87304.1 flagellar hook assembly protein FlgD [Pseudoalteromonas agarivorans]ENN98537.1 flagellar basal body rod modification protein [Pseudoalteromonas agarivorans S816]|tara:strand:+ start:464 stop:1144 length:681 start_codon:yes stop_codon:yes gene_type:complete
MSNDISTSSSFLDSITWQETQVATTTEESDALTQEDFFSLLTQQLSYQDPSNPADNDQMIAQMTNFTMAQGITDLNTNFESLASSMTSNSALQASTLVGKQALLESNTLELGESGEAKGSAVAEEAVDNLTIKVTDASGQLVRTIDMGSQAAGAVRFSWDGNNESGERLPEGEYTITAEGSTNGEFSSLPVATFKNIESVNINGSSGIIINTKEGAVRLTDVAEIA